MSATFKGFFGYIFLILLVANTNKLKAQARPNPCTFPNVNCGSSERNGILNTFNSDTINYVSSGRSMPIWLAVGDVETSTIDTTETCSFIISKLSGPGEMTGIPGTNQGYYTYLDNITFSEQGTYNVSVYIAGSSSAGLADTLVVIVPPEIDFCNEVPARACSRTKGNQLYAKARASNVVPVDAVFPVIVGVIDSITGIVDSTYMGTIYVDKLSGPGELYGTLSMSGGNWFNFNNLRFSEEGVYIIGFWEQDSLLYAGTSITVDVFNSTNVNQLSSQYLLVYPNPFSTLFSIYSTSDMNNMLVSILSLSGQTVFSQRCTSLNGVTQIDAGDLTDGTYFLTLVNIETGERISRKVIKK